MKLFLTLALLLPAGFVSAQNVDTLRLTDNARQRNIPVAFYYSPASDGAKPVVEKVITLDHRRMNIPRVSHPAFLTLRSSEFQADEGVLPTDEEIKAANMKMRIIQLKDVLHHELSNDGTEAQLAEIHGYVLEFLQR